MKNNYGKDIDIEGLKKIYNENPLFQTLIDFLADEKTADLVELKAKELQEWLSFESVEVSYVDARRMLQELDGWDCGWFKIGRRGHDTRFIFNVLSKSLAKAVAGDASEESSSVRLLTHRFRLRPDLEVTLELPEDLSDKEVTRISDFLKTVPFDDADSCVAA